MPVKKKVDTTKNTDNTEDDKKSVSTESDIESGTFSQYDEEEAKEEDNEEELVSDSENVEDEIVDAEDEIEEGEEGEEQAADTEEVKPKKKKVAKKTVVINNDCLYNNIDFEEDYDEKDEQIPDNKRITINRLTKYERVRIIGIRAKQIMTGANILLRGIENKTPSEIAELELKHNMVPFKIKRRLPNGRYEVWKLSELDK